MEESACLDRIFHPTLLFFVRRRADARRWNPTTMYDVARLGNIKSSSRCQFSNRQIFQYNHCVASSSLSVNIHGRPTQPFDGTVRIGRCPGELPVLAYVVAPIGTTRYKYQLPNESCPTGVFSYREIPMSACAIGPQNFFLSTWRGFEKKRF